MARLNLRDYILETIKPLAPGERKYWDMHVVAVKKHDEPERDEARARATNVKEAPHKGKGEDGWLKTGTDATQRAERDDVKRLGENDLDEGRWFRTSYGWAGGAKPGGGKYKHPERVAQERKERRKHRDTFNPRKSKETTQETIQKNEEFYSFDELTEAGIASVTDEHGHSWHHKRLFRKPSHPEYHRDYAHLPVDAWHNTHTNHVSDASSLSGGVYFSSAHPSRVGVKHEHTYHMDHYSHEPVETKRKK